MKLVAIAAYSSEPNRYQREVLRRFVDLLAEKCGDIDVVLLMGGYWGFMKVLVDRAIEKGFTILLFPPPEAEHVSFPEKAIVLRTGLSYRLRSVAMVRSCDILVSLGGAAGTIQEIVTAYTEGKPILVLKGMGLATDRIECLAPYIDERRTSRIEIFERVEDLVERLCVLLRGSTS